MRTCQSREAYENGLHVLVEKPLADTMANGREMVAEAAAGGGTLMVSQNYRYNAAPRAVARILAEPWLGAVASATSSSARRRTSPCRMSSTATRTTS